MCRIPKAVGLHILRSIKGQSVCRLFLIIIIYIWFNGGFGTVFIAY